MTIGLPKIEITFRQLAATAVTRSTRGIVALIVKDDTDTSFDLVEYTSGNDVETAKFTATNAQYIKDVFAASPNKLLVVRVGTEEGNPVNAAIEALGWRKYNWIGFAEGNPTEQTALVTHMKSAKARKNVTAVVFGTTNPDAMNVVNLTNTKGYDAEGAEITGEKLVAKILGILAATSMTETATYKVVDNLVSVEEPADVEAAIGKGEFVLINDEGTVRIGRAVNSLVTLGTGKTEDMKKIAIIEALNLMREDITTTFKNDYLGKYKNNYDNQVLFISAINSYFDALADEQVLDSEAENVANVNVEAQRAAWVGTGKTEAAEWEDATVKVKTFRSNVYLSGNVKVLDGMEDLQFDITME